jgi:hypothetical protein
MSPDHSYIFSCAAGPRYFGMGSQCSRVKSPAHASCIVVMWNRLQDCMAGRLVSQLHAQGHDNDNWAERHAVTASFLSFHSAVFRNQQFLKTKETSYSQYNDIFNWASKENFEIRWFFHVGPSVRHYRFRLNVVCGTGIPNCVNLWGGAVGWGTALQAGRTRVRIPHGVTGIFHWLNLSSCYTIWKIQGLARPVQR